MLILFYVIYLLKKKIHISEAPSWMWRALPCWHLWCPLQQCACGGITRVNVGDLELSWKWFLIHHVGVVRNFLFNHCFHNVCIEDNLLFFFPRKPAAQCTCAVGIRAHLPPPPHPLFTTQTYTQNALRHKKTRQTTTRAKQSHIHYIRFRNSWIHYPTAPHPPHPGEERSTNKTRCKWKKGRKKNSAYNQTGLTLSQTRGLGSPPLAEFACVGLHLFECVRACSALFTVKRMKCQIVLHL